MVSFLGTRSDVKDSTRCLKFTLIFKFPKNSSYFR